MKMANRKPYRILSLAGGGHLGLYTACVLAELEARAGKPLGRCFDLIAGTSVGGILARHVLQHAALPLFMRR